VLIDIFVRIEGFFKRLESHTEVPPTAAMADVILKIIIEVLSILAIATKEVNQGRSSESIDIRKLILTYFFYIEKFVNKLLGRNDIEDALKRLETLITEEARMAIAETLNVTHRVDDKVGRVDEKVSRMDDKVNRVDDKVMVLIDGGRFVPSGYLCISKHGYG
jgi:hypothetical protein